MIQRRLLILSLLFSTQSLLHAQHLILAGENSMKLNYENFKDKKIVFNRAEGDWYAKADDAHGTISLFAPFDSRLLRLDLEWDGKGSPYTINDDSYHARKGSFWITLPDKDVYGDGLSSTPEELRLTVTKIDPLNVSFSVEGTVKEDGKDVDVSGSFKLKKSAVISLRTANYHDCDNIIYDKLTGAENRSPSECEVKFDMDVKTAFSEAFEKAINVLVEKRHFKLRSITELVPIEGAYRGTEKYPSRLGTFSAELQLDPESEEGKEWYKKMNDASEEIKAAGPSPQLMEKLMKLGYTMKANTEIYIVASINSEGGGQGDYKSEHKLLQLPGAVFAVQGSHVQARSGGGIDNSLDVTSFYMGRWKPGTIQKDSDGGSQATTVGYFDKSASLLSVQNISVRLECSAELANEIIQNIDMQKLKSVLR
jgi:hypothetical protein